MTLLSIADELDDTLPTPRDIQKEIPLGEDSSQFIQSARRTVEEIINGLDSRLLMIVGPCSIHEIKAAREYAERFRKLSDRVSDQLFLVMRTYLEKPRTIVGWKGILYDPDLDGSHQLAKGVRITRKLLSELTELGIPLGSEFLELNTSHYYSDFITWGCVGARTCASPPHRQLAAALSLPIGFKNSIDGNIDHSIHAILSAETPHIFLGISERGEMTRIQAEGNSQCHVVLRGGGSGPNYHPEAVDEAIRKCQEANIRDRLIIDCSHDNCGKQHTQQIPVFRAILEQIANGNRHIRGMMLESHLYSGAQPINGKLRYGVSVTDPCLDWETTEELILEAHSKLQQLSREVIYV